MAYFITAKPTYVVERIDRRTSRISDDVQTAGDQSGDQVSADDHDVERERHEQQAPHAEPLSFTAKATGLRFHCLLPLRFGTAVFLSHMSI